MTQTVELKVLREGTTINDFMQGKSINIPHGTFITYADGTTELFSNSLAGDYSAGCDHCSIYYDARRFEGFVKYQILDIGG